MYQYLFGTPVRPRAPFKQRPCKLLILGAYPSAIYVKWTPTSAPSIRAVAVADEPEPFWDGEDQEVRLREWERALPWNPDWGDVSSPGKLNGSSGIWLDQQVLSPLGISRDHTWITDCLDTYHESKSAASRLNEPRFRKLLAHLQIPDRHLPPHPSESRIVQDAQLDRLREELTICQPKHIISLGNAALCVFAELVEGAAPIQRLAADSTYGRPFQVRIPGPSPIEWIPLAHPAAPGSYQRAHAKWRESQLRAA